MAEWKLYNVKCMNSWLITELKTLSESLVMKQHQRVIHIWIFPQLVFWRQVVCVVGWRRSAVGVTWAGLTARSAVAVSGLVLWLILPLHSSDWDSLRSPSPRCPTTNSKSRLLPRTWLWPSIRWAVTLLTVSGLEETGDEVNCVCELLLVKVNVTACVNNSHVPSTNTQINGYRKWSLISTDAEITYVLNFICFGSFG